MFRLLITKILFFIAISLSAQQRNISKLAGHYEGGINRLGSIQIVRFDIYSKNDSVWATYDDPASAVFNAPFFKLDKLAGDTLLFNFGYGNFKCMFYTDVNEITGVNTGWNPRLELHMRKYGKKVLPSFTSEDIQYKNGNITIAASFFKPVNIAKYPVVVLLHGSDITLRSTGYYYSLAYNLAENGIGVLLYDKRGCGNTSGDHETASFTDLATDAVAGVNYIKKRKDLPVTKIGLLGTSQGCWVSYIAAKKSQDIQFVVANVGPAVSLFQQDMDRIKYSMQDEGYEERNIDSALIYSQKYFDYVDGKISWLNFQPKMKEATISTFADYINLPTKEQDEDVLWWRRNKYDPADDLSTITCPVLSLMGGKDVLVPPASNEILMNKYLTSAGIKYNIKTFPNCGHATEVFSTLKGGDWKFPDKFWIWKKKAPGFYETIVDWIKSI